MDQTRFDEAMARISQGLKRVELASEALAARSRAVGGGRDEPLRARVSAAIAELDEMIRGLAS